MRHFVLLGDSVFDNAAYVAGGPEVVEQLRTQLPAGWRATLRAVDGSVTSSAERQLDQLPRVNGGEKMHRRGGAKMHQLA